MRPAASALRRALEQRGVRELYTHQAEAIRQVLDGEDVCIVTGTASGKTLCYNVPVVQAILDDPQARALYLFPTKALAQDQLDELYSLIQVADADIKTFTYDGDTAAAARRKVRQAGHVVITNPDMLHQGILPHHTQWTRLFENLRFIVLDGAARLSRHLRQPSGQRAAAVAASRRVLRLATADRGLLRHHRQPQAACRPAHRPRPARG